MQLKSTLKCITLISLLNKWKINAFKSLEALKKLTEEHRIKVILKIAEIYMKENNKRESIKP